MSSLASSHAHPTGTRSFQLQQVSERYDDPNKSSRVHVKSTSAFQDGDEYAQQAIQDLHLRHERRIRIAKGLQYLLTSLMSLAIAYLHGSTYLTYQQTKNINGAWPNNPDLLPTILMLAIAAGALVMDLFALGAYLSPLTAVGRKVFTVVQIIHYLITAIKVIAYGFAAVYSRRMYAMGNSSGQNQDLWSWSCSDKSTAMAAIRAEANCTMVTVGWSLSIANVGISLLGILVFYFVDRHEAKSKQADLRESSIAAPAGNAGRYGMGANDKSRATPQTWLPARLTSIRASGAAARYARIDDKEEDRWNNLEKPSRGGR